MEVRHTQYLGTSPMNQLQEAVNSNETTAESVDETEPAENAENTEKLRNTIMVSEISIFTLDGESAV